MPHGELKTFIIIYKNTLNSFILFFCLKKGIAWVEGCPAPDEEVPEYTKVQTYYQDESENEKRMEKIRFVCF